MAELARMQTSATGNRQAGFTLVELLVVLFILGIVSAAVVLSIRDDPKDALVGEAERFAARAQAAQTYAVINGCSTSILVNHSGYTFSRRAQGQWQPIADNVIPHGTWRSRTRPLGKSDIRIVFDPVGLTVPARLHLVQVDQDVWVEIGFDGKIQVAA